MSKPLRRDRGKNLDYLAKRTGDMLRAGCDPIMVNDLYIRLAADWDNPPQDKVDRLVLLQDTLIDDIVEYGRDPDATLSAYRFLWRNICERGDPWPDDPTPGMYPTGPTTSQKAMALASGAVAGHYGYRIAKDMLGGFAKVAKALAGLLR